MLRADFYSGSGTEDKLHTLHNFALNSLGEGG